MELRRDRVAIFIVLGVIAIASILVAINYSPKHADSTPIPNAAETSDGSQQSTQTYADTLSLSEVVNVSNVKANLVSPTGIQKIDYNETARQPENNQVQRSANNQDTLECSIPAVVPQGSEASFSAIIFDPNEHELQGRLINWGIEPGAYQFTATMGSDGIADSTNSLSSLAPGVYNATATFALDPDHVLSCSGPLQIISSSHSSGSSTVGNSPDVGRPGLKITSPSLGETVTGASSGINLQITGTSSDNQSGVEKVELRWDAAWGTTGYRTATPASASDWSTWSYNIKFDSEGHKNIYARVTDAAGNKSWKLVEINTLFTTDATKPVVTVSTPVEGSIILGAVGGANVSVTGTASDFYTGIQRIEVRTENTAYSDAIPGSPSDWSTWSSNVTFATSGQHQIVVRATDKSGNMQWQTVNVTVQLGQ